MEEVAPTETSTRVHHELRRATWQASVRRLALVGGLGAHGTSGQGWIEPSNNGEEAVLVPGNVQPQVSAKQKDGRAARKEHYDSLSEPDLFATAAAQLNRASDERLILGALEAEDRRARIIELLLERDRDLDHTRGDLEEDEASDGSLATSRRPVGAVAPIAVPPARSSLAMRLQAAGATAARTGEAVKLAPADADVLGEAAGPAASPRLKRLRPAGAAVLAGSGRWRPARDSGAGGVPDPDAVVEEYVREVEAEAVGEGAHGFRRDGFVLP